MFPVPRRTLAFCLAPVVLLASGCVTAVDIPPAAVALREPPAQVAAVAQTVREADNVGAIGIARIEDGKVVWSGYWGEETPGKPAGPGSYFNVASVAKTVMAETTLRLADKGLIDLDAPIAEHYEHPDLASDARYALLTPRILLSHQAGLRNWAYEYEDDRLAFIDTPGNGEIHYSGAGITILMRYLEAKLGQTYPELVDAHLFGPLGVEGVELGRTDEIEGHAVSPVGGDGTVFSPFTGQSSGELLEVGSYNPADNLYATVPGYASLLVALMDDDTLSPAMQRERWNVLSSSEDGLGYVCVADAPDCPSPLGFGLGWTIFGEPARTVVNHGGNDFGEHAQVYFIPETREGLVLFMSGGGVFEKGLRIIEAVDPDLLMARHYRALFDSMAASAGES